MSIGWVIAIAWICFMIGFIMSGFLGSSRWADSEMDEIDRYREVK